MHNITYTHDCQWLIKANDCGNKECHLIYDDSVFAVHGGRHAMSVRYDNLEMNSSLQDNGSRKAVRRMIVMVAHMM